MTESTRFCTKCGTELAEDAGFCGKCGKEAPVEAENGADAVGHPALRALADRYEIEGELGQGGMAIVYLAHDVRHDRSVALKLVRPDLSAALGSERFLREIQIAAKLTHPNIVPLYDSGEADGALYYVMPFIEGESLRDLIEREGQLSVEDAIRITREVADALAYAHSMGVVHRDIKPENVLLAAGHAVVADFGIAHAVSESGGERLTQTGMSVGTPSYMSPEQVSGEHHYDGRTDIYSLGCVLYEMIVGEVPFTGPTAQAVMARHSMDAVPPPHTVRDSIPDELEDVILKALSKTPADRFHSASDLAETLDAIVRGEAPRLTTGFRRQQHVRRERSRLPMIVMGAVTVIAVIAAVVFWRSIGSGGRLPEGALDSRAVAVLYFEDLSPGGELAHITDGMTEDLIDQLSRARAIEVISRNGVEPYRTSAVTADSIARALDVGTVVDGSVDLVGDSLRVLVRLFDGESGVDFDRISLEVPIVDVLGAQDSVAGEVARQLRERIGEEVRLRERRVASGNSAAWILVQRGERSRKEAEQLLQEGDYEAGFAAFERADSLLASAEELDRDWVEPIVMRGWIAYRGARLSGDLEYVLEQIDLGLGHAERALALDARAGWALELRGTVRYFNWILGVIPDPDEAEAVLHAAQSDLEAAVEADPSLAGAHSTLSHLYYQTENIVEAVMAARTAYQEDAYLSVADGVLWRLFLGHYDLEQLTQARRWCDEGALRFPEDFRFTECQLWAMTMEGVEPDADEAWRLWSEMSDLVPEGVREIQTHRAQMIVGGILGRAELGDSARITLDGARVGADVDPNLELHFIEAYMRTVIGEDDEAIALLRRYFAANPPEDDESEDGWDTHWWWRGLRNHPEFEGVTGRN